MAEFPALPLFTDAYLGDTRHLTTAQHGAYLLLLMIAWRTNDCALPDDDTFLARCVGMDKRTWAANRDAVLSFWFKNSDAKLQQKRLLDERNFAEQVRNKNSAAGKASALKRKNRGSTSVQPNANQTSTPSPSPSPNSVAKAKALPYTPLFDEFWTAYPRKDCSKAEAFKAYNHATQGGTDHDRIIAGTRAYADHIERDGVENRYRAHAATWINQKRWEADYNQSPSPGSQQRTPNRPESKYERAKRAVQQAAIAGGYAHPHQ